MALVDHSPDTIRLSELSNDGESFLYSRTEGNLNEILSDCLGNNPYDIRLTIQPIGDAYEVRGKIQTTMDLLCSRCGIDLNQGINEKIHEILMIKEETPKRGYKESRANHASEMTADSPFCTFLDTDRLNVGEFLHELIASMEPIQPMKNEDCKTSCPNFDQAVAAGWILDSDTEPEKLNENNPFAALKDIKLQKNQNPKGH